MARRTGGPPPVFREIIEDGDYQTNLKKRAIAGILAPAVETKMWDHYFGKPAETVDLNIHEDLSAKSPQELMVLLESLKSELGELQQLKDSIH